MKREFSDMDSESDDVFGDDSKGTPTQSNDSCQMLNRKRRRGIIEKRRRDRINNSLSELRRLVPAAFEKQGSAKLEKAEILQMTVDHLKMLHAKGFDALSFDPHKFAMDYHNIGFRECASEVARYLVAMEGMDLQDPLRLRLMSHLQCYSAQRDLALKSSSIHSPWSPGSFSSIPPAPAPQYPTPIGHHHGSSAHLGGTTATGPSMDNSQGVIPPSYGSYQTDTTKITNQSSTHNMDSTSTGNHYARIVTSPTVVNTTVPSSTVGSMPPSSFVSNSNAPPPMMPSLSQVPGNQYIGSHGFAPSGYSPSGHFNQHSTSSNRPYRPWGAELAY